MRFFVVLLAVIIGTGMIPAVPYEAEAQTSRPIVFPVLGGGSFSNDFNAPRSGGRTHNAIDILAPKMTPVIAAADGTIRFVAYPEPSWGYSVTIEDEDGWQYRYLHMNNDTPGTDDGQGGGMNAYALDILRGNPIVQGQLIGWLGDSGNAETTAPHLHFEMYDPSGNVVNPYESLVAAPRLSAPRDYPALPGEQLPYGKLSMGGEVAVGNLDADENAELITAPRAPGAPHVRTIGVIDRRVAVSSAQGVSVSSLAVSAPAGVKEGDMMIAAVTTRSTPVITPPAGWTLIRDDSVSGTLTQSLYRKAATAAEPEIYQWNFSEPVNAAAVVTAYSGIDTVVPIEDDSGRTDSSADTTVAADSVTVSTANAQIAGFFSIAQDTALAAPESMSEREEVRVTAESSSLTVMIADAIEEETGATGTKTADAAQSGVNIGQLVALKPSAETLTPQEASFYAYDPGFSSGVNVAAGDVNGDGIDEIITGAGPSGGPHVRVFSRSGVELSGFYAYAPGFSGGVRVAAGDIDGDSADEIITAPMGTGGTHVKAFAADGALVAEFMAYDPRFLGGVSVAAGDTDEDGTEEIITAPGLGGGPHVKIFKTDGVLAGEFMAYDSAFQGGVRIAAGNVRRSSVADEIITIPQSFGTPHARVFDADGNVEREKQFFEPWWVGGFGIASGVGEIWAVSGPGRRVSVREWEL